MLVYNKIDFAKARITGVPRTFNEFLADCAKLKSEGHLPHLRAHQDGWHQVLWFPENGPQMQKLDPGLLQRLNLNKTTFAGNQSRPTSHGRRSTSCTTRGTSDPQL